MKRLAQTVHAALVWGFLLPVRFYRQVISPNVAPRCRYYPTCSAYAEQAVRELGIARGSVLAAWRLVRCNPFSPGGFDRLEDRRLFRDRHDHHHGAPTTHPSPRQRTRERAA